MPIRPTPPGYGPERTTETVRRRLAPDRPSTSKGSTPVVGDAWQAVAEVALPQPGARVRPRMSTLRREGRPSTTQDSLPAAGHALPGGIGYPLDSSEGFSPVFYMGSFFPRLDLAHGRFSSTPTAYIHHGGTEARRTSTEWRPFHEHPLSVLGCGGGRERSATWARRTPASGTRELRRNGPVRERRAGCTTYDGGPPASAAACASGQCKATLSAAPAASHASAGASVSPW